MRSASLLGQYAGFVSRGAALALDATLIFVVLVLVSAATTTVLARLNLDPRACLPLRPDAQALLVGIPCWAGKVLIIGFDALFIPLYYIFFWTANGQTLGNYVMGIRVVRLDGHRMNPLGGLLRLLGYALCIASFGIGFLWCLVDDRRMGWHDKLATTCVIYAWHARHDERFAAFLSQMRPSRRRAEEENEHAAEPPPAGRRRG
jgi:uncharacterized RDD family membrane protein YckC